MYKYMAFLKSMQHAMQHEIFSQNGTKLHARRAPVLQYFEDFVNQNKKTPEPAVRNDTDSGIPIPICSFTPF